MSYMLQAVLLVFVLACAVMAEAFWSGMRSERSLSHSLAQSIVTGGGFILYAVIDYLLIVPGAGYLMA